MFADFISDVNNALYGKILIILLVLGGLYFTLCTRFVQFRMLGEQFRLLSEKPEGGKGVSSFQALMVSTASRVGTGNIIGVSTAICLGGFGFVGFPGEPFTEIGLKVKEASKMEMTICSCITNGGQGYFPTASAFAEKGYERSTSPFAHDVAQKMIDAALELIDGMELQTEETEA